MEEASSGGQLSPADQHLRATWDFSLYPDTMTIQSDNRALISEYREMSEAQRS